MRIKVVEKRLGRIKAYGQAFQGENLIEIDPRQTEKELIDKLIHELLDLAKPEYEEEEIIRISRIVSEHVWKSGYRRIYR